MAIYILTGIAFVVTTGLVLILIHSQDADPAPDDQEEEAKPVEPVVSAEIIPLPSRKKPHYEPWAPPAGDAGTP